MNNINILILVSTAVSLLALWMIVGARHLKYLKKEIDEQWELIDEQLRKRQNILPNLIETVRTERLRSSEPCLPAGRPKGEQNERTCDEVAQRKPPSENLIYVKNQEALLEKMISDRIGAAKEYFAGVKKIELEHELSQVIKQVLDLGKVNPELGKDTNFLELRKEIYDIGKDLELKAGKYNGMVRYYNNHRNMMILRPLAGVFKFEVMNIFEVES